MQNSKQATSRGGEYCGAACSLHSPARRKAVSGVVSEPVTGARQHSRNAPETNGDHALFLAGWSACCHWIDVLPLRLQSALPQRKSAVGVVMSKCRRALAKFWSRLVPLGGILEAILEEASHLHLAWRLA